MNNKSDDTYTVLQLSYFVEDMPVVIKNYERVMSVSWILAHSC